MTDMSGRASGPGARGQRGDAPVRIAQYGVILNTANYRACVAFYRDTLGLAVTFERATPGETLTCFDLGGAYLMVEPGGTAAPGRKTPDTCPAKLRLNTPALDAAVAHLRRHGVAVEVRTHGWGQTAEFCDPDGNRCALRVLAGFGA